MAHYPKHIPETISQAYGAAGRALTLLSHDTVTVSGSVCEVKENKCMGCGACIDSLYVWCHRVSQDTHRAKRLWLILFSVKETASATQSVQQGLIFLKHFTDEDILSQIDAAVGDV